MHLAFHAKRNSAIAVYPFVYATSSAVSPGRGDLGVRTRCQPTRASDRDDPLVHVHTARCSSQLGSTRPVAGSSRSLYIEPQNSGYVNRGSSTHTMAAAPNRGSNSSWTTSFCPRVTAAIKRPARSCLPLYLGRSATVRRQRRFICLMLRLPSRTASCRCLRSVRAHRRADFKKLGGAGELGRPGRRTRRTGERAGRGSSFLRDIIIDTNTQLQHRRRFVQRCRSSAHIGRMS